MNLVGIDLAWNGDKNPSAIAVGTLHKNQLTLQQLEPNLIGLSTLVDYIKSISDLQGLAIDASLLVNNQSGYRACELELSNAYRSKWASCHPTNLNLYPDPFSVKLSKELTYLGIPYFGDKKWQIECYPHASIIEIFGLEKRLLYKKGKVAAKREGQKQLAIYLSQLHSSSVIQLQIPEHFHYILESDYIDTLKGQALKTNEDALDAIICLYTAALYASQKKGIVFGNPKEGAVWVPREKCILENNWK